jgi:two-component system sensor histidine kinase/response regulator
MKGLSVYYCPFVIIFFCFSALAQEKKTKNTLSDLTTKALNTFLNEPDSAISISRQALNMALANKDKYYEGYAYYLLSKTYWVKANYRLSTEFGFKALKIFEQTKHKEDWSASLLSLARTLCELGNYTKAKELIQQSYRLANDKDDKLMLAESHRENSYLLAEIGKLDSALFYADEGISLYRQLGDSLDASILYGRKSRIHFMRKDFRQSRKFALWSVDIDARVGNRRGLGIAYFQVAQNEYVFKNYKKAEELLHQSISINYAIGNLTWLVKGHDLLARLYLQTKRPLLAAGQFQLVSQFKDSLYNAEKSGQVQEMQSLYELEGKVNTIKLLEQENTLRQQEVRNQRLFVAFLWIGILFLVVLIFFLTRLGRIQIKANLALNAKNIAIEQQKVEMQEQAEKLQRLNTLQTKLFSVISHDLRGPIANLQTLLDLFTRKLMTGEELRLLSDKLKTNLNITQRTLENLLNWALSQMDGIKTEKKTMDIQLCLEEVCRLLSEVANRKNMTLQKDDIESIMVLADPDQIQLVLRNLIHNSIKFSKIGDQLVLSAALEKDYCRVTIQDSGIGMTQEEIDLLIGSNEHFTKMGTLQEKGTGLGLQLCKEFIERNGGTLSIKSKLGEGTEVSFTLTLAEGSLNQN